MSILSKVSPIILDNYRIYFNYMNLINRMNCSNKGIKRPIVTEEDVNSDLINNNNNKSISNIDDNLEEPTTCCMSGCNNCVWIQYAERLSEKLTNSNADVQKLILEKITDPNMKAFLSMELRCRNLIK